MNRILLMTYRNSYFRDALKKENYEISEYSMPVPENEIAGIGVSGVFSYLIIEVNDDNSAETGKIFRQCADRGRAVCIVHTMSAGIKSFLMEHGISDVLDGTDPRLLAVYLKTIDSGMRQGSKILILEENRAVKRILENVIDAFEYLPVFHDSADEILESLKLQSVQMILVNLGFSGLDLNGFIRKSCMRMEMKKIPLIAYKDMKDGLLVHEVISGLNRLSKFILDIDELCGFLLEVLFRKKSMELADSVFGGLEFKDNTHFARDTLSQIYYSKGGGLFELDGILEKNRITSLKDTVHHLGECCVRAEGLLWLKKKPEKRRNLIVEADA